MSACSPFTLVEGNLHATYVQKITESTSRKRRTVANGKMKRVAARLCRSFSRQQGCFPVQAGASVVLTQTCFSVFVYAPFSTFPSFRGRLKSSRQAYYPV